VYFSYSALLMLVVGITAFGIWHDNMQVRELANRIAVDACKRQSLQFLDGTVALAALKPRLRGGLCIERTYVFDYTVDGTGRLHGFLIMRGHVLEHLGLDARHAS
jgi:hypothetical protein